MTLKERIEVMSQLGEHILQNNDEFLKAILHRTHYNNKWFTIENQEEALSAIASSFLDRSKLIDWANNYDLTHDSKPKKVGLVLAGNIPMVGFHDILCVFISGNISKIKLSDKDKFLLPYILQILEKLNPKTKEYFEIVEKLRVFDAVIATGSNNSARYFEAYFGKYPHIIRKNRNAIAVLNGKETELELKALGNDIFKYYGLGCRNVSKIYVPENFDFEIFLEILHSFNEIVLNPKYKNNFDYNYALLLLNKESFKNNGCIILREDPSLQSRIASLHYEYYDDLANLEIDLHQKREEIQCIVANEGLLGLKTIVPGKAQAPELLDYADGVDTMKFLQKL